MSAPVVTISVKKKALDPEVEVMSVEVRKEIGRIPEARIVLLDGSVAERKFKVSDDDFFAPGKPVDISVRHEGKADAAIFSGIVVRQIVEASAAGSQLRVELRDRAHVLTRQRKTVMHRVKSDHEVFSDLVGAAAVDPKLEVGPVPATTVEHTELLQYQATDWDFLQTRAEANACVIVVDDGKVSLHSLLKPAPGDVKLRYGLDDIDEFQLELDGSQQWKKIESSAWDPAEQAVSKPVAADDVKVAAGNLDVAAFAPLVGGDAALLYVPASLTTDELGAWANGRLARSRLSLLRGHLVVEGRVDIKPFSAVSLEGVGKRFNGKLLVSGVTQRVDLDGWRTELQLGLSPEPFAAQPDIADLPAGGLLPAVHGLQLGVVLGWEDDDSGELRIKVKLGGVDDKDNSVWARMARPDAGNGRGVVFWPEAADEVVVGFLAGDPRQAIILGSLHGSKNAPPDLVGPPDDKNDLRGLVSRAGSSVVFDDKKKSLTIATPGGNTVVLDDDAKQILIEDSHGNKITMSADGIKLESAKDLTLNASGKVTIKGQTVDIE
jgi:Rhs element Vgr protein